MSRETVALFYSALTSGHHPDEAQAVAILSPDVKWCAAHPVNDLAGPDAFLSDYWHPIKASLPDVERRPFMIVDGEYEGRSWVSASGYLVGTFASPLFDIPATGKALYLRFFEFLCVEDGQITEAYVILDFLDAMNQAGVNPIRPALGKDEMVLPPITMDGLAVHAGGADEGQKTCDLVMDMIDGLLRFDGKSLDSMNQEAYWHPDFMWYGPSGIGTTRGLSGFRKHHQRPFLVGVPDRGVHQSFAFIGQGNYASIGGWPHMHGTHTGPDWLGMPATGKPFTMRVFDFWRRERNLLRENWVAIDLIDMLHQVGYDVFEEMRIQQDTGLHVNMNLA